RPVLEMEREAGRSKRISELNPGDLVDGRVKSIVSYGAFVDLNGIDGLLHIADIDWGRVNKVEDFIKVDKAKGKISLGLKQMTPDPWSEADKKYRADQSVEVEVTHFVDYGVFVRTP